MATIIADNIISPVGASTEQTYRSVKGCHSELRRYDGVPGLPFAFTASLFNQEQRQALQMDGYTDFEALAIRSIRGALAECNIPIDERTVLIISSTKGNVGLLTVGENEQNVISQGVAAERIAQAVGITTTPLTVCNACISGVSALLLAQRLLSVAAYDYAIVCGIDLQNPFIISGFQSFKALSADECRPFDIERLGLNLGEAAATVVLSREAQPGKWQIRSGAVRNDAYHISSPSPQGDGSMAAITRALDGVAVQQLALINAHGTATMYNDQMESKAISRAGLSDVPVNALKGYLGHTMGAAGVIESVLTMHALDEGVLTGTRGFDEIGVSGKVDVVAESRTTDKKAFLKLISGFGGCNGALLFSKEDSNSADARVPVPFVKLHRVHITPQAAEVDGERVEVPQGATSLLTALYKSRIADYPKYYKMDPLARLGFVATELLLKAEGKPRGEGDDARGVIFFNRSGSYCADKEYLKSIIDPDNFFPSPSLFVYTLPNIVAGEVAIRNKYRGETAFYLLPQKDNDIIDLINGITLLDSDINSLVSGWLEYEDDNNFEADIYLLTQQI